MTLHEQFINETNNKDIDYVEMLEKYVKWLENKFETLAQQPLCGSADAPPKLPSFDDVKSEAIKNDFFKDAPHTSDDEFVMIHFYNAIKKLVNLA